MTTADTPVVPESSKPLSPRVWRIEVRPRPLDDGHEDDPLGRQVAADIAESHLVSRIDAAHTARVFLIEAALDEPIVRQIADQLLADPVNQQAVLGASPTAEGAVTVEVHYLPGVMDPVAVSTADAIHEMLQAEGIADRAVEVRTGYRYDLVGPDEAEAERVTDRLLANRVVQSIHIGPHHPQQFLKGQPYELRLQHVAIRELDDEALTRLSREAHLFLSLNEMQAIQNYYRDQDRDPTDIELETLAQTWSEHCVHKTLKSRIRYRESQSSDLTFADRPGHTVEDDGSIVIDNLLKSTIAAATTELREQGVDWCISVFVDNAGIIAFDDEHGVTFKVETHNHPSAIEPYGGAATGIGGCIRDTMGTGLVAKPIANTDVFCVAYPEGWHEGTEAQRHEGRSAAAPLPKGVLHPRRILKQVVAGVRDYGNRMGIPTVNGAVYFDDRYLGNPLVFAGSVGLIPRDRCFGEPQPGDRIIALGGRTGRDGIHGATFSSAELTDTHADEFSHAVQIGNAITEKKVLDVMLQARDHEAGPLFTAVTDCGAGGFSSAVGEMGEKLGATVQLDRAPLKYAGLSYTEIWISEAQERMVVSVPEQHVQTLAALCERENVEWCDLGSFGTEGAELVLRYDQTEVGRLSMDFLHNGIPQPVRDAVWSGASDSGAALREPLKRPTPTGEKSFGDTLHDLLSHPNIASKHWIIRQYDHEVQGSSVVKPVAGVEEIGPSDASVIRPKLDSEQGVALSVGLQTMLGDIDPYWMTLASMDEAIRNAVCVGADPSRIAVLDNFCWASCEKPENLGSLVRAAEACYDGAMAYRTPFISGKDSLNNQFTTESGQTIAIPPTLLISAIGIVPDVGRCVTMDAKQAGNFLLQVGCTTAALAGSHYTALTGRGGDSGMPRVDLAKAPKQLAAVAKLIAAGSIRSAHDCSEGGLLVAAAEMAFAGGLGLSLDLQAVPRCGEISSIAAAFAETPSRILIEVEPDRFDAVIRSLRQDGIPFGEVGRFNEKGRLTVRGQQADLLVDESIETLRDTWLKPLDW